MVASRPSSSGDLHLPDHPEYPDHSDLLDHPDHPQEICIFLTGLHISIDALKKNG